jgi:hypothetical protein
MCVDNERSLSDVLTRAQNSSAGLPVAIQVGQNVASTEPVIFDSTTAVSEVWIIGNPGAVLLLSSRHRGKTLLLVRAGAPRVHLRDLHISSPVHVEGGYLSVSRCTFLPSISEAGRMLSQSGGEVTVSDSTFEDATSGAVLLTGGSLILRGGLLRNNAADQGGAMLVRGGYAAVSQTRFEANSALLAGGALRVDGGSVSVSNRTLLTANSAPVGGTIDFASGTISYTLPTPLARYLFITSGNKVDLSIGAVEVDYPFACPGEHNSRCRLS